MDPIIKLPNTAETDVSSCLSQLDQIYGVSTDDYGYKQYVKYTTYRFNKQMNNAFPTLRIIHRDGKASYIEGYFVRKEIFNLLPTMDDYSSVALKALAYIRIPNKGQKYCPALVYDIFHCFSDTVLLSPPLFPIAHIDNCQKLPFNHICTNKKVEISASNYIFSPISVAERLFNEYQKVDNGGTFALKCHPHGGIDP